ncbi:hypothetical protein TOTORO_00950 [Serratia phage vB_SmaS-Totoro]|nr:hypothetical protein TOTORO_00950 [Serratia phage vB_SmaS-Totoro]
MKIKSALSMAPVAEVVFVSCKVKQVGLQYMSDLTYSLDEDVVIKSTQSTPKLISTLEEIVPKLTKRTFVIIHPWEFLKTLCETDFDYVGLMEKLVRDTLVTIVVFHKPSVFKYNETYHPKLKSKIKTAYRLSQTEFARTIVRIK